MSNTRLDIELKMSLKNIPEEVLEIIITYLDLSSISNFNQTCKLYRYSGSRKLWKNITTQFVFCNYEIPEIPEIPDKVIKYVKNFHLYFEPNKTWPIPIGTSLITCTRYCCDNNDNANSSAINWETGSPEPSDYDRKENRECVSKRRAQTYMIIIAPFIEKLFKKLFNLISVELDISNETIIKALPSQITSLKADMNPPFSEYVVVHWRCDQICEPFRNISKTCPNIETLILSCKNLSHLSKFLYTIVNIAGIWGKPNYIYLQKLVKCQLLNVNIKGFDYRSGILGAFRCAKYVNTLNSNFRLFINETEIDIKSDF
jgi:hypothetical protein